MINFGLQDRDKLREIEGYMAAHLDVAHVIVFSPEQFQLNCDFEQYGWKDIIMYKVFYPLLEKIDSSYLLVVNELMRTSNRQDLTYNCLHHYLNQTPHRLIFQWFPMIDAPDDIMILADCEHPGKYKGRGLSDDILRELPITGIDRRPAITVTPVPVPEKAEGAYENERDKFFDNLGSKDPDTIPRQLHLWAGKYKRALLSSDKKYVARNQRFKMANVATYANAADVGRISIDIPHRRMILNDYLYRTHADQIIFLATPFKIDQYYASGLHRWHEQAGEIYAQTSIRS